ncbi:hypothetical protein FACS189499_09170 [Clostridia bacterium]|nr:hypothetical protein FACS189499_09170 [Clostridia bacterium]
MEYKVYEIAEAEADCGTKEVLRGVYTLLKTEFEIGRTPEQILATLARLAEIPPELR